MATMYDSGYGGDMGRGGYGGGGGYDPLEEERRRRREQQQGQQQQNPYQQQIDQAQQAFTQSRESTGTSSTQPVQTGRFQQQQEQRTFAQRQQAGEARPAPPQPNLQAQQAQEGFNQAVPFNGQLPVSQMQPMRPMQAMEPVPGQMQPLGMGMAPVSRFAPAQPSALAQQAAQQAQLLGLDPIAAMMNPEGFQQHLAAMNGGGGDSGTMQIVRPAANAQQGATGAFTGDLGAYLTSQLNGVGQGLPTLPTAYEPDKGLATRVNQLASTGLPQAPEYRPNTRLLQQAQQLTQGGRIGAPAGGSASTGGAAPAGVSAAGVDPAAALAASRALGTSAAPAYNPNPAAADMMPANFRQQGIADALTAARAQALETGYAQGGISGGGNSVNFVFTRDGQPVITAGEGNADNWQAGQTVDLPGYGQVTLSDRATYDQALAGLRGTKQTGSSSALDSEMQRRLLQALDNPSAFDNAAVQQLYDRMGQNIDDQYAQQQTALREEMAARGLSDSSLLGGRLADLNVGQRQARTELANQLGIQRAQDFAQQRNALLGLGMQQQGQNLQAELGRGNLSLGQQRQALDTELGRGNLSLQGELGRGNLGIQQGNLGIQQGRLALDQQGQQFGQQMQGLQFQNMLGQQDFQNQMSSADFGLRRAGQAFNQGLQGATFENMLGQQGFQNKMSVAELQRLLGNDAFAQRMGVTDRLTDYGQRAFDNDLRSADFNRNVQNDAWRRYLDSIVLGG